MRHLIELTCVARAHRPRRSQAIVVPRRSTLRQRRRHRRLVQAFDGARLAVATYGRTRATGAARPWSGPKPSSSRVTRVPVRSSAGTITQFTVRRHRRSFRRRYPLTTQRLETQWNRRELPVTLDRRHLEGVARHRRHRPPPAPSCKVEGDEEVVKVGSARSCAVQGRRSSPRSTRRRAGSSSTSGRDTRTGQRQGDDRRDDGARAGTKVDIVTDCRSPARSHSSAGVLADVSSKLLGQFVEKFERDALTSAGGGDARGRRVRAGAGSGRRTRQRRPKIDSPRPGRRPLRDGRRFDDETAGAGGIGLVVLYVAPRPSLALTARRSHQIPLAAA